MNLDETQTRVDHSLALQESYAGLHIETALLEKRGAKGAEALRAKALRFATEAENDQAAYGLLGRNMVDAATAVFQRNLEAHSGFWNISCSLAEAFACKAGRAQATTSENGARSGEADTIG